MTAFTVYILDGAAILALALLLRHIFRAIRSEFAYRRRMRVRIARCFEDAVWQFRDEWTLKARRLYEIETGTPSWLVDADDAPVDRYLAERAASRWS